MYRKHLRRVYKVTLIVCKKTLRHFLINLIIFSVQGGSEGESTSEDCLYVQITTRKWLMMNRETEQRPYIQYIHGGGYNYGSGSGQGSEFLAIALIIFYFTAAANTYI